jgi:hypothetical protein
MNAHPAAGSQVSVVQALLSLHTMAVCVHVLAVHPSMVQALLPLHDAGTVGVCTHPEAGLHASVVQISLSSQLIAVWTQPAAGLQESTVQALLSLHCASDVHDLQTPSVGSQD